MTGPQDAGDGRSYWDRHAKNYDRSLTLLRGPLPRMLELIADDVRGKARVLEVAAGTGLVTPVLAHAAGQVVSTDFSDAMVSVLRERVRREGLKNVECLTRDIYELGFDPGTFDAVVGANVLHLVPDLPRAVAALGAALRPGGMLVVPTFCHDETRLSRLTSRVLALTGFPGRQRFTSQRLRGALTEAGVVVHRHETLGGLIPIGYVAGTFKGASTRRTGDVADGGGSRTPA